MNVWKIDYELVPIAEALSRCGTERKLARALGCSPQTIYQWRWRGESLMPELFSRRWRDYERRVWDNGSTSDSRQKARASSPGQSQKLPGTTGN